MRIAIQVKAKQKTVIPAQAGIQAAYPHSGGHQGPLDSRLRGNDEGKFAVEGKSA